MELPSTQAIEGRATCRPPDLADCFIRCTRSGGPSSRRVGSASVLHSRADSMSLSTTLGSLDQSRNKEFDLWTPFDSLSASHTKGKFTELDNIVLIDEHAYENPDH